MIPPVLAHATHRLDNATARRPSEITTTQINNRKPYFLHLKQSPDQAGAIRLACPVAGTFPTVNCSRRPRSRAPSRSVDLTDARQTGTHPAARPTVITPAAPGHSLPDICRQQSITIRPGDLGTIEKFRQDVAYLTDTWTSTFKVIRAQNEGINGILTGHHIDISEPKNRLAHGRVAQTLLVALMATITNLDDPRHVLPADPRRTPARHRLRQRHNERTGPAPTRADRPSPAPGATMICK
ncbi:hypothetical protein OHA98_39360 [Streptomyces sp. NBC_00654]|uniref:hypothetical protein n=1 Tax=Streptomyces sp. NBC_00654 TaxID=2975799 RepID=UPI00225B72F4|nr:hypothetical protein [Streptomyces sp. NBC_00654]MCX4970711.1 hypothetical protein [Streptomyces sp. NBC_00654]